MSEENENELAVKVAELHVHMGYVKKNNDEIMDILHEIKGQIILSNSDRVADIVSLKISLKNKIRESMEKIDLTIAETSEKLSEYHEDDVRYLKDRYKRTGWTEWPNQYPKSTIFVISILFMSAANIMVFVWENRKLVKEIIDYIPFI